MPDVIVTHRLTKYYDRRCVVNNLDLRVPQGSVYGLLGRNGTGKSTTIKMLLGMVHPDYGRAGIVRRGFFPSAAGNAGQNRLSGRRASALSLDDHRPGGAIHPGVLSALERCAFGADLWTILGFPRGPGSGGSPAASGPRCRWPWPWPPIRNC